MNKGCANALTNLMVLIVFIAALVWVFGRDDNNSESEESSKSQASAYQTKTNPRPSDSLPSNERAIELVKALPCGNKQIGKDTVGECLQVGIIAGHYVDMGWTVVRRYYDLRVIRKLRYVNEVTTRGEPLIAEHEWSIDSKVIHAVSPSAGHITANPLGNPYK